MRERQIQATHEWLSRKESVTISYGRRGELTLTWKMPSGATHAVEFEHSLAKEISPDELFLNVPEIYKRYLELERKDRDDAPAYDRT